ncbi:hypothetical protein KJZ63_01670 [Patescibacteria group bacterium]|nr:hypothetical protein [Patescibacteria group bacterium]
MSEGLRNPQVLNGEMFPRNHYLGLESVRKLHNLVSYLRSQGINMMAIPTIKEVEAGLLDGDLEKGTVLGLAAPLEGSEKDMTQVVVWDGYGVTSVSILMYLHKEANNWKIVGEEGYQKPNFGHQELKIDVEVSVKPSKPVRSRSEKKRRQSRHEPNLRTHQRSFY